MKTILKCLVTLLGMILFVLTTESFAQQTHIDLGLRVQKSFGLYYENGFVAQFSADSIAQQRLYLGIGYVSSRLGSAIGSNAIKQDNYQVWLSYYFKKDHKLQPFVSMGSGFFHADYESDDFEELDQSSLLLSTSAGLEYTTPIRLKVNLAIGYNLISGNGQEGPGTLYPVFGQLNFYYPLK
ncbi:hypothetical protein [Algoriphagus aquimarinus]|uniref:Outer membrane protein beta-barrel domain-containing protein n=1 Tax=Algoriphagus aquimarinus TaxID=237018 RepID=A0A5C7AUW1_9BACT|nr:hypothetical protein [Algoriphagus aquimarinus]TXE11419.1 hypothetical protein ESV85_10885 [Algoriphagus aquimarinus]